MTNLKDTKPKAVPYSKEVLNNIDKKKYTGNLTYPGALIKKLKAISEQQIIGNR